MVTIKDIAKHAGVSIATVSRVINGNYYVSPETKEKVIKALRELNYYPNSIARSLKTYSTYTIGFLVSYISNTHYTTIAKGVEEIVNEENYSLIACSTEENKERELKYLKILLSRRVDGLIINTTGENDEFIAKMSQNIPIVFVHRRIYARDYRGDFVDFNCVQGSYDLTKHLLNLGHRKIFVINGKLSLSSGIEKFTGFVKAMSEVGIRVDDDYPYRYDGDYSVESGYQGAAHIMQMQDRPTAVVIMNNTMAMGAYRFFKNNQIKVPDEISVASFVDIENADLMYVRPCVATMNPWIVGRKAGELILDRIKGINNNREVIYESQVIPGDSVKPLTAW